MVLEFTNRFIRTFQIKLCGVCCLASAVLCVVITVTTTVIHMNRLQTLRECVYQGSIQTCTCFAGFFDPTMTHHDGNNKSISNIICNQKKFPKFSWPPKATYDTTSILLYERGILSIWSFNGFGYVVKVLKIFGSTIVLMILWYFSILRRLFSLGKIEI